MKNKVCIFFILLLSVSVVNSKELVELKPVPLLEFMKGDLNQSFPVDILVPKEYQSYEFEADEAGKYYWMRPKDAKKAIKSSELPIKKGFMYGKVTTNVGYDINKDLFIGIEDESTQKQMEGYLDEFLMERVDVSGYPVLLVKMVLKETKKPSYLIYLATKIASNVVVIAHIPPKYSEKKGDYVREKQLALFKQYTD